MAGKLKAYKEKIDGYKKFYLIISTIKKIALAKYRVLMLKTRTRDSTVRYSKKVFDLWENLDEDDFIKSSGGKLLYLSINTNRGNCGPMNSNQYKYLSGVVEDAEKKASIFIIGKKGTSALPKLYPDNCIDVACINDDKQMKSLVWADFALANMDLVAPTDYDRVQVLMHRYISAGVQRQCAYNIPSWDKWTEQIGEVANAPEPAADSGKINSYRLANAILDKEEEEVRDFYEFHRALVLLNAVSENELSEAAARVVAVEGQLTNIIELLDKYTQVYNKTRQGAITSALIEILSAMTAMADAQKGSEPKKTKFWEAASA